MKIYDQNKFKQELQMMFKYKWSCIKEWMQDSVTEDIIKFIDNYENERPSNDSGEN